MFFCDVLISSDFTQTINTLKAVANKLI